MHRSVLMRMVVMIVILMMMMMAVMLIVIFSLQDDEIDAAFYDSPNAVGFMLNWWRCCSLWQWWWRCLKCLWCLFSTSMPINWLLFGQNSRYPFLGRINISGGYRANQPPPQPMILSAFSSCYLPTTSRAQVIRGFLVVRFLLKKVQTNESHFHSHTQLWYLLFVQHIDYNSKVFFFTLTSNNTFFRSLPYRENKEAIQYRMLSLIDSLFLFSDSMSICHKSLSWFLESVHS